MRLNDTLIPSEQPGSPIGFQYQFVDQPVESRLVYYYWLDCVHLNGSTSRHGPVSAVTGLYRFYLPIVVR